MTYYTILVLLLFLWVVPFPGTAAERPLVDQRSPHNPLITPDSGPIGDNINGPTVIRAPDWLPDLGGRYLMYFAHHNGKALRLAVAPTPEGPWALHSHQVLPIKALRGSGFSGHIASPDIIIDNRNRHIIVFFHAPARWDRAYETKLRTKFSQLTGVAVSANGVDFELAADQALAFSYFRHFVWRGQLYGLTARALVFRGHATSWPQGMSPLKNGPSPWARGAIARCILRGIASLCFTLAGAMRRNESLPATST